MMRTSSKILLIIAVCFFALLAARWLTGPWFESPGMFSTCTDSRLTRVAPGSAEFSDCLDRNAKLFLEKDYAESKDLAKTFLTLLSAILVASITFSEKIVDIHNAKQTPLIGMILCWILLLGAIVFTGSGLATIALAAGFAAYYPGTNYRGLESHAVLLFIAACFSFGVAMLALITSGAVSLAEKRRSALNAQATLAPIASQFNPGRPGEAALPENDG